MNLRHFKPVLLVLFAQAIYPLHAQTGFPFSASEGLHYTVNWPSGLSLGDASFTATRTPDGWTFTASVQAGVPGFSISDLLHSKVTGNELCSTEFERDLTHGGKHTIDKITFDQEQHTAKRTTTLPEGGGKTDFDTPSCAHDALAFVYLTRLEMGQGRMPPGQPVYFGSSYSVSLQYTGEQDLKSPGTGGKTTVTDKVEGSVKGPQSTFHFEIYFARDPQRTPLAVRIPTNLGTIALELVR
ncbi:MAG TPA: DUF3108 domain-containing protein [Bryobacteraceae bacterium]|nr:DUF3108 domain-containing protein [Bryobacteraceae bacterium]